MPAYQRPQRQQKEDPLQMALQLFQMFQQPQQGDEMKLAMDLQAQQADRQMKESQFAQEQALREQVAGNEQAYREGTLDVANRGLQQKNAITPEMRGILLQQYMSPDATPQQKMSAKLMLDPSDIAAIDADVAAQKAAMGLNGPVAGGGPVAGQPPAPNSLAGVTGWGQPMAGGGPMALGHDLGSMIMSLFQQPTAPEPPIGNMGDEGKKRLMRPTYSEGRAPNY